jgi:hypothetical protein
MALAKFLTKQLEAMDKAAKKFTGSPGYDEETAMAQKEFAKEKKAEASKKLTKKEEAAADKEAYASAMGKDKPASKKGPLTAKEKKELQDSLEFRKGGSVAKKKVAMAKGGSVTKMANCGASVKPAMACGGMAMKKKK